MLTATQEARPRRILQILTLATLERLRGAIEVAQFSSCKVSPEQWLTARMPIGPVRDSIFLLPKTLTLACDPAKYLTYLVLNTRKGSPMRYVFSRKASPTRKNRVELAFTGRLSDIP
jgi:hypothetical protein